MRCLNCNIELELDKSLHQDLHNGAGDGNASTTSKAFDESVEQDTDFTEDGNLGHLTVMHGNLFDMVCNSTNPIKHPLCQECVTNLLDCMDSQLAALESECEEYTKVLSKLQKDEASSSASSLTSDLNSSRKELARLQADEKALRSQLDQLALEEQDLDNQLKLEQQESKSTDLENKKLWQTYRDLKRKLVDVEHDEHSTRNQLKYVTTRLDTLSKTNIFNMAFHIWHQGQYGTINGFRLGWLPNDGIDWSEVNAAWGQTTLLITCLARSIDYTFQQYEPIAMGPQSYIKLIGGLEKDNLPLYTSYGGQKFQGGHSTKFDNGMVAFVDCLNQLQTAINLKAPGVRLPYTMNKDKLIDKKREYSVRMHLNAEERWTKSMKFLLENMKWALAWVASLGS